MSMDINKAETPEDEREISLNETSLKRPLDVIDVVGGHGPWQFRQWFIFLGASLCNSMVLFSALFLPSQTFCFYENAQGAQAIQSFLYKNNYSSPLSEQLNYVNPNGSFDADVSCNTTGCKASDMGSVAVSSAKLPLETECWNSEIEIYTKCSYFVACILSGLVVYFTSERFGRRPLALVSCLFLIASSLGSSWAGTTATFLILRFISSLGIVSIYLISAFSLIELVHKDFKLLYFFTGHLGWGMAHFLLPAVAWLAKDWMSFNVILGAICVLLSIFVWLGPESPSSFPNRCEQMRMRKALKYAAFINGYSTTDVDLLSHNFRQRQENKHDAAALSSGKTKVFCIVYSSILFLISFTTVFLYFATKWHPTWFKVNGERISFSFLGTTEVAATVILLFLTCIVPIKYLWATTSVISSSLLVVIFSRKKSGISTSSVLLYTVTVFFASASWTLILARSFCHKISSSIQKFNLALTAVATFIGALFASAIVLKAENDVLLLVLAVPHLIFAILTAFIPDEHFGVIS